MDLEGTWLMVLVCWQIGLIIWTEAVGYRSRNTEYFIRREVSRRMARRRPRRYQSHVKVHPVLRDGTRVADEVEQWLRDRSR